MFGFVENPREAGAARSPCRLARQGPLIEFPYDPPGWTVQRRDFMFAEPVVPDADGYVTLSLHDDREALRVYPSYIKMVSAKDVSGGDPINHVKMYAAASAYSFHGSMTMPMTAVISPPIT